ncbi:MAG TPA: toxin-antitoxin system HicB family antitoxin [Syntrophomonadaceae bacterium]|nr:toxin-antitoxin system HicB family antitoxin [Syntrophomonadaceae bacterium]HQD90336.1 toxin-antitoxin system HicB family antitoxin [Syntrophomonadaceae bacterium]
MNRDDLFGYSARIIRLSDEDGGGWLAEVPELPGCLADGDSLDEALNNLKDIIGSWLEVAYEEGKEIPPPRLHSEDDYSGKFTVRIPKTLHRLLVEEAEKEGVSLNQLVLSLISYNLGIKNNPYQAREISLPFKVRSLYEVVNFGQDDSPREIPEAWAKTWFNRMHSNILNNRER